MGFNTSITPCLEIVESLRLKSIGLTRYYNGDSDLIHDQSNLKYVKIEDIY